MKFVTKFVGGQPAGADATDAESVEPPHRMVMMDVDEQNSDFDY
jgi:hypothetical protein